MGSDIGWYNQLAAAIFTKGMTLQCKQLAIALTTNFNLDKYIFFNLDTYIFLFGQIHFAISTYTFDNLNKYILKL